MKKIQIELHFHIEAIGPTKLFHSVSSHQFEIQGLPTIDDRHGGNLLISSTRHLLLDDALPRNFTIEWQVALPHHTL